jgi:hypothetical protein
MLPERKINLIGNTKLVQEFRHSVEFCTLGHVPTMVKRILQTGAWRERYEMGRRIPFEKFSKFITTSPDKGGCGMDPDHVEALINKSGDVEALAMWRAAMTLPKGTNQHTMGTDNISIQPKHGTSRAYTLDRLARERPDLFEQVRAGELSANAAAIEAGFRRQRTPLERALRLLPNLTDLEWDELKRAEDQRRRLGKDSAA